jgi:Carboxypeptidase regulatory-like domain
MTRLLATAALVLLASCARADVTQPTPTGRVQTVPQSLGTLPLSGWVADTAGRLLEGARVEIMSGSHAGAVTITDRQGQFAFSQLFSDVPAVGATKEGYLPASKNVWVHNGAEIRGWFRLGSPNPPVDLTGNFTLTFTADPACQSLPSQARSRTYHATMAPQGLLQLEGARFVNFGDGYVGNVVYVSVFESFVRLDFGDPPIWELLDDPTSVYIFGSAEGTVSGPVSAFSVAGEFEYCGVTEGQTCEEEVACESDHHRLVLTRR